MATQRPSSKIMAASAGAATSNVTDVTPKVKEPKAGKEPKAPSTDKANASPTVDKKARKAELKEALAKTRAPLVEAMTEVKKLELQQTAAAKDFAKVRGEHTKATDKLVAERAKELAKLDKDHEAAKKASDKALGAAKAKVEKFQKAADVGAAKIQAQIDAL